MLGLGTGTKVYCYQLVVSLGLWLPRGYDILTTDCGMHCLSTVMDALFFMFICTSLGHMMGK